MGIIRILPAPLAGRIAAGEVIERPASVVKELVENAIDAGATRIRISTEQGGQRLIQVTDDGRGMDREDAMLCLEAHATSKIASEGDVGNIHTLGFRGEALPSISSVSRFELVTRTANSIGGTRVTVNHGSITDVSDCGCAPGTTIRVGYLFANLPARRKFLKGPGTEDDCIHEMVLMMALSRPAIAFELVQNNREVLRLPANGTIADRVRLLIGRDAFDAMLPVEHTENGIHVYGFISRPGFTRSNRREQRVVINGRAAAAETIFFAIREAYDTLILRGRYPGVALYIDLADDRVDVNVHPAKREVRFREPMIVSAAVATALRTALRGLAGSAPDAAFTPAPASGGAAAQTDLTRTPVVTGAGAIPVPPLTPVPPVPPVFPPIQGMFNFTAPSAASVRGQEAEPLPVRAPADHAASGGTAPPSVSPEGGNGYGGSAAAETHAVSSPSPPVSCQLYGPLGSTHLVAQCPTGLIVINIKPAMQRILFERLLANLRNRKPARQQLLLPLTISLSPDESRLLTRELPHFDALGYTIEPFGSNTFLLTATPANLRDSDLANTMHDLLSELRRSPVTNRTSAMHLAQATSRYARTRFNAVNRAEQEALLQELMHCEMPYTDPNGAPTMIHISYSELAKRFKP